MNNSRRRAGESRELRVVVSGGLVSIYWMAEEEEPKETNLEGRKKPGGCPQRSALVRREFWMLLHPIGLGLAAYNRKKSSSVP